MSELKLRPPANKPSEKAGLLDQKEGAEGEGVDAGAVEAADGAAGIGDEGFAEEVERGVDEDGGGGGFAEFVEEFPEKRVGLAFDGVDADIVAVEGEAFEAGDGVAERGERRHGEAVGRGVEIFGGALGGNGESERVKFLAVLDELIDVFDDVFGEGRGEKTAIAEGAMAEFGAALAPGDDFVAMKKGGGFFDGLIFAGEIAISDFAVVEDGLDFVGIELNADGEVGERGAAGAASDFFARKQGGAEGGASVAGDGLYIDMVETGAGFERVNQENVEKHSAGKAEGTGARGLLKICGELENDFLEIVLGAAGEIGAKGWSEDETA